MRSVPLPKQHTLHIIPLKTVFLVGFYVSKLYALRNRILVVSSPSLPLLGLTFGMGCVLDVIREVLALGGSY